MSNDITKDDRERISIKTAETFQKPIKQLIMHVLLLLFTLFLLLFFCLTSNSTFHICCNISYRTEMKKGNKNVSEIKKKTTNSRCIQMQKRNSYRGILFDFFLLSYLLFFPFFYLLQFHGANLLSFTEKSCVLKPPTKSRWNFNFSS